MLRLVLKYAEIPGKTTDANFTVTLEELECCIGLQLTLVNKQK